jgi:hypothetical protein
VVQVWTERLREWLAAQVLQPLVAAVNAAHKVWSRVLLHSFRVHRCRALQLRGRRRSCVQVALPMFKVFRLRALGLLLGLRVWLNQSMDATPAGRGLPCSALAWAVTAEVLMRGRGAAQCFAKCPFTCQFDRLCDQLCRSLDRLFDPFAKHWCCMIWWGPARTDSCNFAGRLFISMIK